MSVPARFSENFLKFPSELGKFDGLFNPSSGNQSVFFFHIKDAHASAQAQENIARILTRLYERKQLDLVFVEGAAGSLMPKRLDVFEEPQKNAAYKKDLFNAGLLNGAAYFIASQKGASSYGLEEPGVYFDHLQIFRRVVAARPGTEKFFNAVEVLMMNTFKNILRVDVFVFLKEWKMQHQRELSWGRYLPFLIRSAEKFLGLDLQDYHAQVAWPNLVRFRHVDLLQDQIHAQAVQKEFREVSKVLEGERDPALRQTMTLLSATIESQTAIIRETPDFRKYVEILVEACRREGVLLQQYPNLVRYLAFRIFRSEIEPEGLLAEVERLEDAIFDKLFSKGKMRGIISAYRDFFLLKRAFELDLDRSESKRFLALDIEQKVRQFSKISQGYDLQEENVIRGANLVKQFYMAAQKRDGVFMEQVKNSLDKAQVFPDRPFFIALVTGGYHAEGIENWFRTKGLPFASIQPSFRDEAKTDRYENLLMGDYRTNDTLAPAQGSIEPDATAKKLMGRDAFLAFRSAEASIMAKHGVARSQNTGLGKSVRHENRSTSKEGVRRTPNLAGRSEVRSGESKPISEMNRRRFLALAGMALAGLVSGCATVSHTELKKTLRAAEEYALPQKPVAVLPVTHVDSRSLLQKVLENDPKVKKAEIEIVIKEIEKDRLKGSWSIFTKVALVDGKPVFSGGLGAAIPHVVEGGVAGYGVGSLATLAVDLAASLSSILRGEPMLAKALAEKIAQTAQLNHQKVIGDRYAHYAGIALEIKELQALYETSQKAIQALEAAMVVSQGRVEASELERMKIRNIQSEWQLKADEYRSSLKAKEALLVNLYAPGMAAETEFVIDLKENTLPPSWKSDLGLIERLRHDATTKSGKQPPPNRELAVAYKGREAAVIVRELEHARGRFSLGFGGFSFIDNLGSPSSMSSSTKGDIGTAWDSSLDRRTKDQTAGGLKGQISFGKSVDVEERVSSKKVEITDNILLDVQRTVEDEISGLVYRMGKNQDKIKTLTGELQRLENDIRRARQAQVAGRRLVTEDKLAEYISEAWKCQMGLIEARAETNKAILKLEEIAGVLGELSWRNVGGGRSELRAGKVSPQALAAIVGTAGLLAVMTGQILLLRPHLEKTSQHAFWLSLAVNIPWAGLIAAYCVWMQDHLHRGLKALTSNNYWIDVRDSALPAAAFAAFFTVYFAGIGKIDLSPWMNNGTEIALKTAVDGMLNYFIFYPLILWKFFTRNYKEEHRNEPLKVFQTRLYFDESRNKLIRWFLPVEVVAMVVNKLCSPYLSEPVVLAGDIAFTWVALRMIEKIYQPAPEEGGEKHFASECSITEPMAEGVSIRSEVRSVQKIRSVRKPAFLNLKLFVGVIALFFSLTTGAFAEAHGTSLKGPVSGADVGTELRSGDLGTELGDAYTLYDGFTARILNTIPPGGGREDLKRFAQILRVTIVSEETLRQAQLLFVREVMHVQDTARSGSGFKDASAGVVAPIEKTPTEASPVAHPSTPLSETIKTAAVSGPSAVGAGVVGAVSEKSSASGRADVETVTAVQNASAAALTELDMQLGKAVPGFKKLLKNPKADPATIEGYREAVLNAILTARPVDPKKTIDPKSFQKVFFNWDNPFHSAWNHRDAMERSVAKGRVVVNPAFRDKINDLAGQAGMLNKVTESEPAPQGIQTEQIKIEGAVSGPVGVAAGAVSVVGNAVHTNVSSEPVVERPNPVSVKPQVSSLGPGSTGVDQLPAPVSQDQSAGLSPVMQILLSGTSGTAEIPHVVEVSDSASPKAVSSVDPSLPEIGGGQQPASASAVSAPLAPLAVPGEQTASSVTHQPDAETTVAVSTAAGGGVTNLGSVINNATNTLPLAGTVSAGASLAESPSVPEASHKSPVVVPALETGSMGGNVFSGKAAVNPVLLNLPAALSGIPEYAVKEGDTIPSGGVILKIIDPENASRTRALAAEIALIDAQLADPSVNATEYANFQFKKESLVRELRERNYQEELRTLKASHPLKVVKLTRGQVNQGDVAVHGIELDAGQISFRLSIGNADFDDAELQVNGEAVRVLRYDLSDFDPVSGQFLLTIDFVSPSGTRHDPQVAYTLKLDRRHEQSANDPALGKNKPFRVMVPHREPAPVTVPVAPGVPGGVFHALVPEGTIVSAGTPVGFIDASSYQQEQLDAAKGLRKLVGEISAANQNFAAVSPEELRRLNAEAGLRIASLEGVNPKIVIRAPVAGRVVGLIPVEGQTVIPGKATGIRVLNSLVFLGSTDLSDSGHLIDVPKGSVREGERVRVRTPLGNVLDGTVFKVQPLADENGLWLSDRDALVVQVEDPSGHLGDDMPVEIWTGVPASEKDKTSAPATGLAALPLHYGSDLPPAVLYQLLRHPDQKLSGSVRSVLAGEGSFRQILSSWKYFFGSPKGLASFGDMIRTGLLLVIGTIVSFWAGTKIVRSLKQKLKWLNPQGRLNDLALETRELQIRLEQKGQTQDKELLEDVITSVNEWIRILSDERDLDHESLSTILIKAQELAGNKHLAFSRMKFQDLGMWKDGIGDDLAAIYGILTVLSILTARRIAVQSQKRSSKAPMELHELHRFQQGIVDYGDIFNESYALAHHLIGMSQTMDLYPPKVVRGLKPLSFFDRLKILHNRLVRFLYPVARMWLWVSPVVFLHKMDTLRSYRSLSRKMERLGLNTPEDTKRDAMNAKQGLTYALNSQVTLNQPAGSKMAMHYGRFWRRFITILAISSLFLPTIVLTFLGLHWLTATALMSIGKIILPFAAIGFHIIPILTNFSGRHHNVWDHELARLRRKNAREERSLPELPKPQAVPKNFTAVAMPRQGSEQIAMSKVLNALHEGAQDTDLEVVALVPPQYGENKTVLEQFIQNDALLRQWAITVAESDGEFPGDAGLFYAARNIAKTSQKKFKIYWYPQAGIGFQAALSVFKINLGEAARMIGDLRAAGVRFGEVAFPGGDLISSSSGITKNGGHFVVQARHASLNEIERDRLPAILGRNGTSRLEIEHVLYSPQELKRMMAAGPLHLGSGRVDLGNVALPQIPVPTGPIAIVAETPEDHQTIQELLDKTDDRIRNLIDRFGPFRIGLLEDVVRPVAELSRQVAGSSATPPNPNLLVNRTVRLSDDTVISPYDKLYTAISRFLWNGGNGNRRNLKAEAFIPSVSETVYVSGKDRPKFTQALERVAVNFQELVNPGFLEGFMKEEPEAHEKRLVFEDENGRRVLEKKRAGYQRGLRSFDVAGFVTKERNGEKVHIFQRRDFQISNGPGLLDVSVAGHMEEGDDSPEAAIKREFSEELLGGRHAVPSGLIFHGVGSEVPLEITHEGRQGLSTRKKRTSVFQVSVNGTPKWDDFLPGDNAVAIVGLNQKETERALRETPWRFTSRTLKLINEVGLDRIFSEPGTGLAGRPEQRSEVNQPPASRSELRNEKPPAVISLPAAVKGGSSELFVRFKEKEVEIPQFQVRAEIRILAAIVVAEKILAANDAGLMPRLEASLENAGTVSGRVAPALATLAGAHDVPVEVLKIRLESLLRQEQIQTSSDDRIVFLDAGTVPAEYFKKLMNSPVPVVVLFDRRHHPLYDQVSKEQLRRNQKSGVLLVYAPDGVSTFVKRALQSGDAFLTASPRLNAVLTRFRNHGKADDIALITSGRAESQKVEADYVGHRYYYGDETLRLDPELIFYSLQLLLRSPELFRYGKGRNAQDAVSLIGLVLQQLAQEFQASLKTSSAV